MYLSKKRYDYVFKNCKTFVLPLETVCYNNGRACWHVSHCGFGLVSVGVFVADLR